MHALCFAVSLSLGSFRAWFFLQARKGQALTRGLSSPSALVPLLERAGTDFPRESIHGTYQSFTQGLARFMQRG
jgi:hypothetical protein